MGADPTGSSVFLFSLPLFASASTGCVAAGTKAGVMAVSEMASDDAHRDPDTSGLEDRLKTNGTTTPVGRAMKEERLAEGMTWTCEPDISRNGGSEIVFGAASTVEGAEAERNRSAGRP